MMDVSVSTVIFDGHSLETAFDETAFSDSAARARQAELSAAGLSARAISAHIDLGTPGAPERLAARLRFAAGVGALTVITNAASRSNEAEFRRCPEASLPLAEGAGVVIGLENPGHGQDALIPDGGEGVALTRSFDSRWLRLNYDVANILTYSEGELHPDDEIEAARPAVAHVHFKDVRMTADGWAYLPLGEGSVALDRLARSVARSSIPIVVELPLRLSRRRDGDPERLRQPLDLVSIRVVLRQSIQRVGAWLSAAEADAAAWTQ